MDDGLFSLLGSPGARLRAMPGKNEERVGSGGRYSCCPGSPQTDVCS